MALKQWVTGPILLKSLLAAHSIPQHRRGFPSVLLVWRDVLRGTVATPQDRDEKSYFQSSNPREAETYRDITGDL